MNVLVANISTFARVSENITYHVNVPGCLISEFEARQTNESVFKCLSHMDDVLSSGGIEKIIMLVSSLVLSKKDDRFDRKSAFEYYRDIVKQELGRMPIMDVIAVENVDGTIKSIHSVIDEVCLRIEPNDTVYIDAAGGQRTINNAIQLLTKLLKYKGIKNPYSLYSNIQGKEGCIENTASFDELLKLTEAFNEFMTTGKSDQLRECFDLPSSFIHFGRLIDSMCEISDRIQIGNLQGLESYLQDLRWSIDDCKERLSDDMASVVTKQFLPVIKHKFFGDIDSTDIDYCRLVRWCLENGLIQQALTIFVEKLPITLFSRGLIAYEGDLGKYIEEYEEKSKGNPLMSADWQTSTFFVHIMSSPIVTEGAKSKAREYVECSKNNRKSTDEEINRLLDVVQSFNNSSFVSIKRSVEKNRVQQLIDRECISSYNCLKARLENNYQFVYELLGYKDSVEKKSKISDTIGEKFSFVKKVEDGIVKGSNRFLFYTDSMAKIMYAYLYVKSVRNSINHASSKENLNDEQKSILSNYGYDFDSNNLKSIRNNIARALDSFESATVTSKVSNQVEYVSGDICTLEEKIAAFAPTTLSVGDQVEVLCHKLKMVKMDGYEVQLVLPKGIDPQKYLMKTVRVEISQISKVGKIVQVKLLV